MTSPTDTRAPIAGAVASPQAVRVGEPVTFTGSGTTDPDTGDVITAYSWSFGDGTVATGVSVTHVFTTAGAHRAALAVTDSSGRTGSVEVPVMALAPTPHTPVSPTTQEEPRLTL